MTLTSLKSKPETDLKVTYDEEADAVYIHVRVGKVSKTVEEADDVQVDLDKNGHLIGVEILDAKVKHPGLRSVLVRLATRYKAPGLKKVQPEKVPGVFTAA